MKKLKSKPRYGLLWLCYHALKASQWQNVEGHGHPCPYCGKSFAHGHDSDCMIGNAMKWMELERE